MKKLYTIEEFIKKAKDCHTIQYDYAKIKYVDSKTKVCIVCPEHGEFWQAPNKHLQGQDCPECAKKKIKETTLKNDTANFLKKAKEKFGNYYDLSKVKYINAKTKVEIICPIHGSFWITPDRFLNSKIGCQKCAKNHRYTLSEWIDKAKVIHHNKYSYDKNTIYKNSHQKMIITCPKHGDFEQEANSHLFGCGCPKCQIRLNQNRLYYKLVDRFCNEEIQYEASPEWLERQFFDIYFPKHNIAIEYNGMQHYQAVDYFGGEESFKNCQRLDKLKQEKCLKNNCTLIIFKYDYNNDYFEQVCGQIRQIIQENSTINTTS